MIIIKVGGSVLGDPNYQRNICSQIDRIHSQMPELKILLVHGGGPAIAKHLKNADIEFEFYQGQRKTSKEMLSYLKAALWDDVNQSLASTLKSTAERLCGFQDKILHSIEVKELGEVGEVSDVDIKKIDKAFEKNSLIVFCPLGIGAEGNMLNINADNAALGLCKAIEKSELIFISDTDGLLDKNNKVISKVYKEDIDRLADEGVISGGMHVKCMAIKDALSGGGGSIRLLPGKKDGALLELILENKTDIGTEFI